MREGTGQGGRRDEDAGQRRGRQEEKDQGKRGRGRGKEKKPKDERATSIPGAGVITCWYPGRAVLQVMCWEGGRGWRWGAVIPNPANSLVICCLTSKSSTKLTPGRARRAFCQYV